MKKRKKKTLKKNTLVRENGENLPTVTILKKNICNNSISENFESFSNFESVLQVEKLNQELKFLLHHFEIISQPLCDLAIFRFTKKK